jgi:penicillin G amidase
MKLTKKNVVIGLLSLIIVFVLFGVFKYKTWLPNALVASYPQVDGTITLAGLDGPVDVYRDKNGVPHIYATTDHDLVMAQGYIHAQDRFWQMDFQRHTSAGRLSELMGSSTIDTDIFLRTLGWERVAKKELATFDDSTVEMLLNYSAGINAYLAEGRVGEEISLEYAFINLLNPGYEPEPWVPLHTATWVKAMAWDLRGNMGSEIDRALMLSTLTTEQIDFLYPDYPSDHQVIVKDDQSDAQHQSSTINIPYAKAISPAMLEVASLFDLANQQFGGAPDDGVGSNSWVISGDLTNTGLPLLANDPHLEAGIPHIWYQIGLHCIEITDDCSLDIVGYSFVGAPLVIIGHNQQIGWGFTNAGPDVMDLFIEKINPDDPTQYEYMGEWVDMEVLTETIKIGADKEEVIDVYITRHGPIISDVYGAIGEDFQAEAGLDFPDNFAIALQWTALEESATIQAVWNFSKAQNWEEFRNAAKDFAVPSQNLIYADVEGNIGYQMPGLVPIRAGDSDGRYPVPGWTGEHEWKSYIPFNEMPMVFNPDEGYIVTANNKIVDDSYPYLLTTGYAYGYRAGRIEELINAATAPIDIEYIQQMQGDNYNGNAELLLPFILEIDFKDEYLSEIQGMLANWDYQQPMESAQAAIFEAFWKELLLATYQDQLPESVNPSGGSKWYVIVENTLNQDNSEWWDDITTKNKTESQTDIFKIAFENAVDLLEKELGSDPAQWQWGDIHMIEFNHQVMNNFPIIRDIFNRGPYPVSGGSAIVNNTNWKAYNDSFIVSGTSPSFRMILDLSNFSNSISIHPTGQSGHAGHDNYIDLVDMWRTIQYNPMYFDLSTIESASENYLNLVP